jgi:hypothetical protein
MTSFAKPAARWANELWNVSLLPSTAANEIRAQPQLTLGGLENIDETRSLESFRRPLRVSPQAASGILA